MVRLYRFIPKVFLALNILLSFLVGIVCKIKGSERTEYEYSYDHILNFCITINDWVLKVRAIAYAPIK